MAELKVNMDADLSKFETVMPGSDCTIFLSPKFLPTNLHSRSVTEFVKFLMIKKRFLINQIVI